ncbi:hypothetical protein C7W88_00010 [Novosphingobium sp. THN1]|nr:hypothetical protein C7W88_00010 [Novosphingobium sp. THN1]
MTWLFPAYRVAFAALLNVGVVLRYGFCGLLFGLVGPARKLALLARQFRHRRCVNAPILLVCRKSMSCRRADQARVLGRVMLMKSLERSLSDLRVFSMSPS